MFKYFVLACLLLSAFSQSDTCDGYIIKGQCVPKECLDQFATLSTTTQANVVPNSEVFTVRLDDYIQNFILSSECFTSYSFSIVNQQYDSASQNIQGGVQISSTYTQYQLNQFCEKFSSEDILSWSCPYYINLYIVDSWQYQIRSSFYITLNTTTQMSIGIGVTINDETPDPAKAAGFVPSELFFSDENCNQVPKIEYKAFEPFYVCQLIGLSQESLVNPKIKLYYQDESIFVLKNYKVINGNKQDGRSYVVVLTQSPYAQVDEKGKPYLGNLQMTSTVQLKQSHFLSQTSTTQQAFTLMPIMVGEKSNKGLYDRFINWIQSLSN